MLQIRVSPTIVCLYCALRVFRESMGALHVKGVM